MTYLTHEGKVKVNHWRPHDRHTDEWEKVKYAISARSGSTEVFAARTLVRSKL